MAGSPAEDSSEEYSYYFEMAYPSEADRRTYIDRMLSGATPSFGHYALATLLKIDKARVVWTTNFDRLLEDATNRVFGGSGNLVTAAIDAPNIAREGISEGRWPLLVKLHGDFHSRRLKNTSEELRSQDAELQNCLLHISEMQGLAVVGYSGRDESVMNTLERAIRNGHSFPGGLSWFHRPERAWLPCVDVLIAEASASGVDAHIVEVETFDELMGDILSLMPDAPEEVSDLLVSRPNRVSKAPLCPPAGGWPVIRTNAFPIIAAPTICRRIVCEIGGYAEVREAVTSAGVDIDVGRRNVGVIAFGPDEDIRNAFAPYNISEFSVHPIEHHRLTYESAELGLVYDALCRAIARHRPVRICRRRRRLIVVDPVRSPQPEYRKLRAAVSLLNGKIPTTETEWAEAVRVRLECRLGRLWLIAEPTIWVEDFENDALRGTIREFVRERLARRYNLTWNKILDGWADLLVGDSEAIQVCAFGTGDGVDGVFKIGRTTAFSWRGGIR